MGLDPGSRKKVERLEMAIEARFEYDKLRFSEAAADAAKLNQNVAQLRALIAGGGVDVDGSITDASVASKHRTWVEAQIKILNIELARAYVRVEEARGRLSISSAKCEVIKRLKA